MNPTKEVLEQVAARVLEDAAFVFAMPLGAPPTRGRRVGSDRHRSAFPRAGLGPL